MGLRIENCKLDLRFTIGAGIQRVGLKVENCELKGRVPGAIPLCCAVGHQSVELEVQRKRNIKTRVVKGEQHFQVGFGVEFLRGLDRKAGVLVVPGLVPNDPCFRVRASVKLGRAIS